MPPRKQQRYIRPVPRVRPADSLVPASREDQLAHIWSMRQEPRSLQEIADYYGLSRERIRQLMAIEAARRGVSLKPQQRASRQSATAADPVTTLRVVRTDGTVTNFNRLSKRTGVDLGRLDTMLEALGVREAVARLFRLRRFAHQRSRLNARSHEMVTQLQTFVATYGRVPTSSELNDATRTDLPYVSKLIAVFGSLPNAIRAAGYTPRSARGYAGWLPQNQQRARDHRRRTACQHGHDLTKDENVYCYTSKRTGIQTRTCRVCSRAREKARYNKKRQGGITND